MSAWTDFVKANMATEMKKSKGDHGKAMKAIAARWRMKKRLEGHKGHFSESKKRAHKGHASKK